jgi:hypothetical protein
MHLELAKDDNVLLDGLIGRLLELEPSCPYIFHVACWIKLFWKGYEKGVLAMDNAWILVVDIVIEFHVKGGLCTPCVFDILLPLGSGALKIAGY